MLAIRASLVIGLLLWGHVFAQEVPSAPGYFDEIIRQMKFEQPTRIVGRFRSLDGYEDAVWIDWTHLHDRTGWREVRSQAMFKVLPRDAGMMDFFHTLSRAQAFI